LLHSNCNVITFAMAIRILVSYIKKRRDMAKMEEGAKAK